MTIQTKIAELLVAQFNESGNPLKSIIDGKTTHEICQLIFVNYRGTLDSIKGLRLSDTGLQLMQCHIQAYHVNLGEAYRVKLQHLLYLERVSKLPYHLQDSKVLSLGDKFFITFDGELAMMLKLADGKIDTLIETRFRLQFDKTSILPDL
jgi:hypothetical protein